MCYFLLNAGRRLGRATYDILVVIIFETNWQQKTRRMFQMELGVHSVNPRLPVYISDDFLLTSMFAKLP